MKLLSAIIICLLFFINCKQPDKEVNIVYPEGGYNYPTHVEYKDTTFYCYPLKDIKSTKDSFQSANSYYFLKVFDEYNLSLKPRDETTFRLIYACSMGPSSIIILKPSEVVIKTQIKGWTDPYYDTLRLNEKERMHFHLLDRWFPLNDTSHKKWLKSYLDSIATVYPELLDPGYYKFLLDKSADFGPEKFTYSITRIPISQKEFNYVINKINEAGYWKLPYELECKNMPMDGCGIVLEANTPRQYNIVTSIWCPGDTSIYTKACQEIIKCAKMEKEIKLVWDEKIDSISSAPVKVRELKLTELKEEKPVSKPKKKKAK